MLVRLQRPCALNMTFNGFRLIDGAFLAIFVLGLVRPDGHGAVRMSLLALNQGTKHRVDYCKGCRVSEPRVRASGRRYFIRCLRIRQTK
jgi:hypothetical protein